MNILDRIAKEEREKEGQEVQRQTAYGRILQENSLSEFVPTWNLAIEPQVRDFIKTFKLHLEVKQDLQSLSVDNCWYVPLRYRMSINWRTGWFSHQKGVSIFAVTIGSVHYIPHYNFPKVERDVVSASYRVDGKEDFEKRTIPYRADIKNEEIKKWFENVAVEAYKGSREIITYAMKTVRRDLTQTY